MKLSTLIICLLLTVNGVAQHQFSDLKSCLAYAYEHRKELQIAQLNQSTSTEKIKLAHAALLPQINAFATLDNNVQLPVQLVPAEFVGGQAGEFAEIQFGTQYNFASGVEATLSLWNPALWNKLKKSHLEEEKATLALQDQKLKIAEQIARKYYYSLLTQELIRLNEQNQSNNDTLYQTAQAQYEAGTIELLELNRVQSLWLTGQTNLTQALASHQLQLDQLKLAMGISITEELALPPLRTFIIEAEPSTNLSFETTAYPQYKQNQLDNELASLELKDQKQARLPKLSAYARYTAQAQRNEFNFLDFEEPWFGIGLVGMRVDVPIFTGFSRKSSIQIASIQQELSQQQADLFLQQQLQQDQALLRDYQTAKTQLEYTKSIYTLAKSNYELAQYKYQHGVFSIEQVITLHNERLTAQNQYLTQLGNYLIYRGIIEVKNQILEDQ
ncbi:MAG: TolC family protein [Flammeovirgaceae bacterium]